MGKPSKLIKHRGIYLHDMRLALDYAKHKPLKDEKTIQSCEKSIDGFIKNYAHSNKSVLK
eukprot:CAMPEP_0174717992 /NCGR_PEP_ID=MMETSP1094-20130205/27743_1 /TAXON_ID=156173 /ORGANISM="Chrysochromulina brevifilum, Strain UTEX LB 985" /LENGTH=59 /DNA_ID=CAMNT_0015918003 /DNA_START=24 /DNA_END=203 /DNA_ORIENTATION=-